MLNYTSPLHFPHLKYVRSVALGKGHNSTPLYTLDWGYKHRKCEASHKKWLKDYHPDKNIPFYPSLPEKYDRWMQNLTFAIPFDYLSEIQRNSRRGLEEWNIHRGFDTNIREKCLEPGISNIYIAFYLIADCAYDETENYYYRGHDSQLIPHALAYNFWAHQTGRGCIRDHAKLYELQRTIDLHSKYVEKKMGFIISTETLRAFEDFLDEIRAHEAAWDEAVNVLHFEKTVEGPSLCDGSDNSAELRGFEPGNISMISGEPNVINISVAKNNKPKKM